jgi:hypothetical protein
MSEHGIKVTCNSKVNNECYPNCNLICVSSYQSWENRFYTLLHEIGHITVHKNKDKYQKKWTVMSEDIRDGRSKRSMKYQVSLISEEIEAWDIGKEIANDCNLKIAPYKYNKVRDQCVMSYITSAAKDVYGKLA